VGKEREAACVKGMGWEETDENDRITTGGQGNLNYRHRNERKSTGWKGMGSLYTGAKNRKATGRKGWGDDR
jgi:hypothetical protein